MKKRVLAILFGVSLTLAACGGGDDTSTSGGETAVGDAESIYKVSCASCHGNNLEGAMAPALDKIGAKYDKDGILEIINSGRGAMPKGIISGSEADAVAEWLAAKK